MQPPKITTFNWESLGDQVLKILMEGSANQEVFDREAKARDITVEQLTAAEIVGCVEDWLAGREGPRKRKGR